MEGFADLLTDAFSEPSVPSFPDGDLDFESLNFEEKPEEDKTENLTTKRDGALHQEATSVTADVLYVDENVYEAQMDDKSDEEDFKSVAVDFLSTTPGEDYTSSEGASEHEGSVSGEDDEGEDDEEDDVGTAEKPGDLLMSVRCSDEFYDGNKEDSIFAEGQPLAPEGAENPQVRNKEQGEAESDEEVSYFGRFPERGDEMVIRGAGSEEDEQDSEEEKQEDSSDPECEGMKIEQEEENVVAESFKVEVENSYREDPAKASLEFPCISTENLQDLIAEVDSEESVEKMKDFSGEEHEEAGESFADYPSDFSSCEYVEDGGKNQESTSLPCPSESGSYAQQSTCLEGAVTDITWTDSTKDRYLYSRDLEMDADELMSLKVAAEEQDRGETLERLVGEAAVVRCDDGESDSYSSSDDEVQVRRSDEEPLDNLCLQGLEDTQLYGGCSSSEDRHTTNNRADPADFINWNFDDLKTETLLSEYLLTTDVADKEETASSDSNQRPAEDVNSYSVVQREDVKTTSPSFQGSVDDSFFFDTELEASGITELGQLGEDERNWEQEQERIKAFYEFYDDSDEDNGREGRQIKVQFCADPLSQVIHYESDSSDRDSLSSSTDREEDLSSAETSDDLKEPEETLLVNPVCDAPNTELPQSESDLSSTQTCPGKHKCLSMLKLILKTGVVTVAGLLMFWLATDQTDWLSQTFFS